MKKQLILLFVSFLSFSTFAQTTIYGPYVSGNWHKTDSPFLIEGDITVHQDSSLTIESGVEVVFQNEYSFIVNGIFHANGIEGDSILFTVADTTGYSSGSYIGWNGITVNYNISFVNDAILEYCIIEYSKSNGIACVEVSSDLLHHSVIRYNSQNGINVCCYSFLTLNNIEVINNKGSGIYIHQGSVSINNFDISHNEGRGLSVNNESFTDWLSLNNGTIRNNNNGGISLYMAMVVLDNLQILDNNVGGLGGGIYCTGDEYVGSNLTGTNLIIKNNTADFGGGIYCSGLEYGQINFTLTNVIIDSNYVQNSGGGIYCGGASMNITNSVIASNFSNYKGGGISVSGANIQMDRATLVSNRSYENFGEGGAIHFYSTSQMDIENSIIWSNTYPIITGDTSDLSITYSDVQQIWPGTGNINENPLFTNSGSGDYTLQWPNPAYPWYGTKSPCIDSGDPASPTDADGTRADMGAHIFYQPNTPISGTLTNDLISSESPYFVYGDLLVPSGETINIEDGVLFVFQDEYYFTVDGSLQANGIAGDSIRFTVPDTTGFSAGSYTGWNGFKFYWATGSSMFDHSIVEYSKGNGLYCEYSNLEVGSSLIRKNTSNGIYIVDGSGLTLQNSLIKENKGNGLYILYHSNLNSTNTTTKNNLNRGLFISSSCDVVLNDFNSTGNVGTGVVATLIHDGSLFYSGGSVSENMYGGILINDQSENVTLENLVIQGNEKIGNGGGICVAGDEFGACGLTGNNLLIDNNSATSGGGIYCTYASMLLDSVIVSNNDADLLSGWGGGIYTNLGDLTLSNSSILNCQAWKGGGFYNSNTISDIDNVIFDNCQAEDGGGMYLLLEDIQTMISYSQISNNTANNEGGGIYIPQTPATVDITNTTMYNNQAGVDGNALITSSLLEPSLKNCIVWGHNEPAISSQGGASLPSISYSDVQGTELYPGVGNINQDPLFVDPDNGDFHLSWTNPPYSWGGKSPCIDKGNPVSPPDPDGTRTDMGAYYYHQTFTSIAGNINDTLKCSESPYYVFGDLTVLSGEDLVVEPCVHVVFMDDYRLNVEGRILVIGNSSDSISFYPADTAIGWQGIRFLNQNTNGQDSSKLEYCKIKYAKADGMGEDAKGGGIYCNNSSELLINKSELSHNQAEKGGGIYCDSLSHPLISENIFEYNQAVLGGGIYGDSSSFQLEDCFIRYNAATDKGGGIYVRAASSPFITDDIILDNTALSGGGIYADSSNCQVSSCFIQDNQATEKGGGIYCIGGSMPLFINDTISSNQANEGGGLYAFGSNLHVIDSYIDQNDATDGGGGIYLKDNSLQVFNNTHLSGNNAFNGGAVFADSCNIWLINSTLDYNTVSQRGGAMYCLNTEMEFDTVNIVSNQANLSGGGMYCNNDCVLNFSVVNFNNNISLNGWGGALAIVNSVATLSESQITSNEADYGGGISATNTTLTMSNVDFVGNTATSDEGGGIYSYNVLLNLDSAVFENNTAAINGGGIYTNISELILFDVDFIGNIVTNERGGGIYSIDSDIHIDSVYFENNQSNLSGGGIYSFNMSQVYISNAEFYQNSSTNYDGGAICCTNASCSLEYININNCQALNGGGLAGLEASYELFNVAITDCSANNKGGGIKISGVSTITLDHVLVADNSSGQEGGGLFFENNTDANLTNVTISNNTAGGDGKAIFTNSTIPVELKNTIMWPQDYPEIAGSGLVNATYSDIEGGLYPGTDNIYSDPYFTAPAMGDYSLRWDNYPYLTGTRSPCIDSGDPTSSKDPDSTRADMGAIPYLQYFTALEGGDIYDTLYCAESPYFVFGDLTVPTGQELVIEPCVNVIFQGDYRLRVNGRLLAQGNNPDSIYFRSGDVDEGWQGIRIYDQNTNGQDSSRFEFCKIMYARADGPGEDVKGGGIYCNNSSELLVYNSEISHNLAEKGGGIYCDSLSNPQISSTILEHNQAVLGGGIYGDSSSFQLEDCFVRYNTATNMGGGIYCNGGSMPVFTSDTISNNQADDGGGLYTLGSNLQVIDSYIDQNQATYGGGGIYLKDNSLQVFHNTHLSGNSAINGGAVFADSCNIWLMNSTLDYNTASQSGGAMYCLNSELEFDTVNILGNQANSSGGGIYCNDSCLLDFSSVNFDSNIAQDGYGGGISINHSLGSVNDGLFSGNDATYGGGMHIGSFSDIDLMNIDYLNNEALDGGALYMSDYPKVTLDSILFKNDTVVNNGGGFFAKNCDTIIFQNSEFRNNSCINDGGAGYIQNSICLFDKIKVFENNSGIRGGGIHFQQGCILNITNSEFFQNTSNHDGGAISNVSSNCNLTNVSIKECISNVGGGGIAGYDASYELSNVNVDSCQAGHGGGIWLFGTSSMTANYSILTFNSSGTVGGGIEIHGATDLVLTNITISNNTASGDGKAIYTSSSDSLEIKNCIIDYHSSPEIAGSGDISAKYSKICGYSGTGNICQNPYFTDPDNGEFTLRWDNYPYLTGIKSPCIDAGDPSSPKDPDSTRADMGAIPYLQYYTAIEGGDIYDTLFCAESPYFVFGDLTVPTGQELVIEPCVNVIFQGDYRLRVDGRLLAQGNDSTFIYFRSGDTDEGWQGIRFYDQNTNGQDSSRLEYCEIKYGNADGAGENAKGGGLYFNNSSDVAITGLYIYYCNAVDIGGGLYCNSNSDLIIRDLHIGNNTAYQGGGIYVDSSYIKIFKGDFYWNDAEYGGGIYCTNSTLDLNEMDYRYNGKTGNSKQGGGIYSWKSNLNINNAEFLDNDTEWDGGALMLWDNSICTISNAIIHQCNTGNYGGGIAIDNSEVEIFDSEIKYNSSNNVGGGISVRVDSELILNNCEIHVNHANLDGGGIYVYNNTNITINNCKISNNDADDDGGGIFANYYSNIVINNSDILSNETLDNGGGILLLFDTYLNMEYTLVTDNSANNYGGGIAAWSSSTIDLVNVTLSKNSDNGSGSAIYRESGSFYAKNSIIWGNTEPELFGSGWWIQYSDFPAPYGGYEVINSDPMFKDPDNGDFNLLWANFPINDTTKSPCINTGDPNSPLDPDTSRADMGALYFDHYQYSPVITSIVDVPDDQGKQVVITWDKSPLDHIDTAKITHYKIWRLQNWAKTPWEYIGETPAHFFDEYAYIAPTISDSTAAGIPYYTYLVSAETADPYVFYNSLADSGYSVDNLAPEPLKNLYGYQEEGYIVLIWNASDVEDLDFYAVYKTNDLLNFPTDPYATLTDTIFIDQLGKSDSLYYYVTAFDINGNESGASDTIGIQFSKSVNITVFFEGPFFISQMIPYLNLGGYIPLVQPYNQPPWNYSGDETVSQIPNNDIVDWVLLEFRDAPDPVSAGGLTTVYKTAAFLKADGTIVGLDGVNPPRVNLDYNYNLYLVVWHRNHVGIMSALPVVESADSYTYDFTDIADKTYGGEKAVKFLNSGMWGMNAGDANADGQIDNKDKNDVWYLQLFTSGYLQGDFNMDTQTGMDDKTLWEENAGKGSFVPE